MLTTVGDPTHDGRPDLVAPDPDGDDIMFWPNRRENNRPEAYALTANAAGDRETMVPLDGFDLDPNEAIEFELVEDPQVGSATIDENRLRYVPEPGFTGDVVVRFRVVDERGLASEPAEVTLKVTGNSPPVIGLPEGGMAIYGGEPDRIVPYLFDVDGDAFHIEVEQPAHGTVTVEDEESFVYQSDPGFVGTDVVEITAIDAHGLRSTATLTLEVLIRD
jgi:hypothetical protein